MTDQQILDQIDKLVKTNDIVLFMKGTAEMPLCGFSARVAGILNNLNLKFTDINILEDAKMRQGIKEYTDWPTIPQLYIKGTFIGGYDIVKDMFEKGELQAHLKAQSLMD